MPLTPALIRDNPWWRASDAIQQDADLIRFRASPVRFDHPIPFALDQDAVYTLRGPRQVGKSTLLKRVIASLLQGGEIPAVPSRNVMYLDVEGAGITTMLTLQNAVVTYLDWIRSTGTRDRVYVLLDEVTSVPDWGGVPRVLYGRGMLAGVTMIATGSHALDLQRGGEMAPGRRGEHTVAHTDWVMMPLGFRDYITAHMPDLPPLPTIELFDPREAYTSAQEIELFGEVIRPLFERYLLTGGYPHPVADEQGTGRIPPLIYQIYRQAIIGQMKRARYREPLFREIIAWAADHRLGKEFSWRTVAADTDVGSKETVRSYIEDAEAMFLWHIVARAQRVDAPAHALRSPKKLYPADPFTWHMLASWVAGDADPWSASVTRVANPLVRGDLVESVVADHAVRRYGPFVVYHRAPQGDEEIDLVIHSSGRRARLEIKQRARDAARDGRWLAKYGGGILATAAALAWDGTANVARIPVATLLAGYAEPVSLFPGE